MSMQSNPKLLLPTLLCLSAMLLSACGGSGAGLIPEGNAGPLRVDFEEVASAAESGNGDCSKTEAALTKTEQDFQSLPSSLESRLKTRLSEGIEHLRSQALVACRNPSAFGATTTASTNRSTVTSTPTSSTTITTTSTTSTETSTETTSSSIPAPNGGTSPEGQGGPPYEGNPGGVEAEENGQGKGK